MAKRRLNPTASRMNEIKSKLQHVTSSSEHGDEAAMLLEQLSNIWAVSPSTDTEHRARTGAYQTALRFLYDNDLM